MRKRIKTIIFFLIAFSTLPPIKIEAGRGAGYFGSFAGGALVGGLIGSSIAKRNRNDRQPVVQERVVERPIYVQQAPQQQAVATTNTYETQRLRQEVSDLRRELRQERKEAERRTLQQKHTRPKNVREYSEHIFDDYDPQLEG